LGQPLQQSFPGHRALPCLCCRQGWPRAGGGVNRRRAAGSRATGALEPVWDELYPAEQARILRLLVERIDVAADGLELRLRVEGFTSLLAELGQRPLALPRAA
jgi:hypothetical protein